MSDLPNHQGFILIPVHNRRETTLACLKTLQKTEDLDRYTVVVIDDGSTDGTGAAIAQQYPQVVILAGDGNLWWTGAIRKGMEYAIGQGAKYIFWLNDDCHPQDRALPQLISFMQSHPGAIAAPACRLAATGEAIENGCRHRQRFTAQPGETVEVESVSGYCVGIPRSVCEAIGYPDIRRFPHYAGDDMYTLSASNNGHPVYLVGDAIVSVNGMENDEHTFKGYLRDRFKPHPPFKDVFFVKKSRYFLPTQYFYCTAKYPFPKGAIVFIAKLCSWLIQYSQIYLLG